MADNIFENELEKAKIIANPRLLSWAYPLFIAFAVWRALALLTCVAVLVLPYYKGSAGQKQYSWLFRRYYVSSGISVPYIVPNRCMVIAICELFANAIYFSLACFTYWYFSGDRGTRATLIYTVGSYLGIWLAGWALVYACLCDVQQTGARQITRILTPLIYNVVWISWPIFSLACVSYWSLTAKKAEHVVLEGNQGIMELLTISSAEWEKSHDMSKIPTIALLQQSQVLLRHYKVFFSKMQQLGTIWLILATVLAMFYICTAIYLLHLVRKLLKMHDAEKLTGHGTLATGLSMELEKEFQLLSKTCVITSIALCCEILTAIIEIHVGVNLNSGAWRTAGVIAYQIPGIFLSPVLVFQSWRIFSGRHNADESMFHKANEDLKDQYVPKLATQLLGWDTTINWDTEKVDEIHNFPGLCQLDQDALSESDHNRNSDITLGTPQGGINITQVIVTTQA
ncbi:hypothetical protein CROQUDRAFT_669952 [Cronartium quercuum f. sp. fusiforme G11]|uniref:Uncharacterized protein n=1 Tax=Cronartium quercuum f. sp. fusiforme G11 TaxID=708437 RepID=A0A9P6TF06_9BASI|nr:hypothetical protein CROQUDRAFT_669952 [Cronartium quercuum f. sp. fusiforme G11]